jgi:hypothetical protein
MRVSTAIFQNKRIKESTNKKFLAYYKGKEFYITDDHGYGKPKDKKLTRFIIDVIDLKSGMKDVSTYQDYETIIEAIIFALDGACLI